MAVPPCLSPLQLFAPRYRRYRQGYCGIFCVIIDRMLHSHAHTHARTHTNTPASSRMIHTHARTHAHTNTHKHTHIQKYLASIRIVKYVIMSVKNTLFISLVVFLLSFGCLHVPFYACALNSWAHMFVFMIDTLFGFVVNEFSNI